MDITISTMLERMKKKDFTFMLVILRNTNIQKEKAFGSSCARSSLI